MLPAQKKITAMIPGINLGRGPIISWSKKTGSVQNAKTKEKKRNDWLNWSGRGDLNPRQLAWEARTLPLSYARSRDQDSHSRCGVRLSQGTGTFG